ncbi:hypothetical protein J3E71DRAFT_379837 [Bipolaris maydis]|nr:hypothetical protein J3E71DRAFT_379837 [Bipolaris maydis]
MQPTKFLGQILRTQRRAIFYPSSAIRKNRKPSLTTLFNSIHQLQSQHHNHTMSSSTPQSPLSEQVQSTKTQQPDPQKPPQDQDQASTSAAPLPLPSPSTATDTTTQLNVDGQAVKLDHLGPLVVNKDGTLSRIANWESMAEIERQNTLRILVKRNQVRLGALRGEEQQGIEAGKKEGEGK